MKIAKKILNVKSISFMNSRLTTACISVNQVSLKINLVNKFIYAPENMHLRLSNYSWWGIFIENCFGSNYKLLYRSFGKPARLKICSATMAWPKQSGENAYKNMLKLVYLDTKYQHSVQGIR